MANLPGGWRRFTSRRKRVSFPDVKWAKVELCQLCLTRSKYLKYRVSFVVSAPGWWFSLLPAFSPRALTYHREDLQVGLSHATLFFLSSLCFYSSCSPGLQSFSITLSIFLNTYSRCRTQQKYQPTPRRLLWHTLLLAELGSSCFCGYESCICVEASL